MKVMVVEITNDMPANLTGQTRYQKPDGQLPKTSPLPAAIGGTSVAAVVVLVIIIAVLYRRRYTRNQMTRQKHSILVSSPTPEEAEYETIPYNTGFGGIMFSDKVNNLSQMRPEDKGNHHAFNSNTNNAINTSTYSGQNSVNTNCAVIIDVSKAANMKVKERNEISTNNCSHKNIKPEDYQIRNTADLNRKPDRLTNTSLDSNEYVNYSRNVSDDTLLYDETAGSQDDLYANSESSNGVDMTTASQSEVGVQDCRHNGTCMDSIITETVTGQRQSHDASANLAECPHHIYINNKTIHTLDIHTNAEDELPERPDVPDELYINFSEFNHNNKEYGTKTERNHCMDDKESSVNIVYTTESVNVHQHDSSGKVTANANNTTTKIGRRNDYQNAHIDHVCQEDIARNNPDTARLVVSVLAAEVAGEYSTVEIIAPFQVGDEQDGSNHSVYSRLREDSPCVVNIYDSFS